MSTLQPRFSARTFLRGCDRGGGYKQRKRQNERALHREQQIDAGSGVIDVHPENQRLLKGQQVGDDNYPVRI